MKIYKPEINTWNDYKKWREIWRRGIKQLSADIAKSKKKLKIMQRANEEHRKFQSVLAYKQIMAKKMHQLLVEVRADGYARLESERELEKELATYPIEFPKCREIIFHYNIGSNKNPKIPRWVLKAKGRSFYVHHVSTDGVKWSTKETPDKSTKGSIRFKNVGLVINKDAEATIIGIR